MTDIHVTRHACERYVERVNPRLTVEQAEAAIRAHLPAIDKALAFGAPRVIMGEGGKILLRDRCVVTVEPSRAPRRCQRVRA